jgi:hypothetical protein
VSEEDMPPSPATPALLMTAAAPPQPSPPPPRPVVDLTEEKPSVGGEAGDDLQRAIELSLAEVGGQQNNFFLAFLLYSENFVLKPNIMDFLCMPNFCVWKILPNIFCLVLNNVEDPHLVSLRIRIQLFI